MSSELHKYIEKAIDKKENLLKAKILKFPKEKNQKYTTNFKGNKTDHWKISDKSNTDQLKAITGFCFTVGILTVVGLYSNLM